MITNNSNSTTTTTTNTEVQTPEIRQGQHSPSELPLWVRIVEAIGPKMVGIGQGLCWIFGSFFIPAMAWYVFTGTIAPEALLDFAAKIFGK